MQEKFGLAVALGVLVSGSPMAGADGGSRPSWLTEVSVTAREGWESNVFLTNTAGPEGRDLANRPSLVTTVSPKVAVDFAPLLEEANPDLKFTHLSLGYAPEIVRYLDQPGENYDAHRLAQGIQASWGAFSLLADNQISIVEGTNTTPQYSERSSVATALIRERRDQIQDRASIQLKYGAGDGFLRPAASLLYYDLQTALRAPVDENQGWQNYADRYDVNGGADFGYKVLPDFYLVAGYRHGHQHQGNLFAAPANSTNDYERVLFGWEGKPAPWLKTQAQFGPDFRTYGGDRPFGHDGDDTRLFFDVSAAFEISRKDTLSLKARQWEWLSGSGVSSYQDLAASVAYRHAWSDVLDTGVELKWSEADYDAPSSLHDSLYTVKEELAWTVNARVSIRADYSFSRAQDMTRNPNCSGREFANHQVGLAVKVSY